MTKLVVASNNQLWTGADPNAVFPYAPLTSIGTFTAQSATAPVRFAATRDPALNSGNGGDILVITGFTGPYSFAQGAITLSGTPVINQTISVTMDSVTTSTYTTLQTDNLASIAQALVNLINASAAVMPGTPFLNQATFTQAVANGPVTIQLYALASGTVGNAITYNATLGGPSGFTVSPTSSTAMTGGGAATSAPLKYDGTTVSGLSGQITNAFTGCVTWHNHVWFWGDPNHPDTLFASDINQPEGFSFMLEYGGYDIGAGDGDPAIRACVPSGNFLYVFKGQSIYAVSGYDFQAGEYQFQVQPAVFGHGVPNSECVAVLNNAMVFWDGRGFYRLSPGSFQVEHIGRTIPLTEGRAAQGDQGLVRVCAGSFSFNSFLNESYFGSSIAANEMLSSCAFFAMDMGRGVADTVLVYDDDATQYIGDYAWAPWTGWQVDAWIPFGAGQNAAQTAQDIPLLCWATGTPYGPQISAYGTNPTADSGLPIPFLAQTGWLTIGQGTQSKELHRLFLEMEASPGAYVTYTISPSSTVNQSGTPVTYNPSSGSFAATGGVTGAESHQTLIAAIQPFLRADAYLIGFAEGSGVASLELVSALLDAVVEPYKP